jgi:TIR domain
MIAVDDGKRLPSHPMKIFICWSQGRSQTLAKALHAWLPRVIDGVEPFLSSEIEKGRPWFDEISRSLRESDAGLVCLTPECVHAPWIHFEAGALANAVDGRLYPYLHGVRPEELSGPLSAFQSTRAIREDTLGLIRSLAQEAGGPVSRDNAESRFDNAWPLLEKVIQELDRVTIEAVVPGFSDLFASKTFTEPMRECPDGSWIARHERLGRVDAVLQNARDDVTALGLPHMVRLYEELRRQLDLYLMNVRSKLLTARPFAAAPDGLLDIPRDVLDGCETPRIRVQQLVQRLLDPTSAPVVEEAIRFDGLDTEQRKRIIQGIERQVAAGHLPFSEAQRPRALDSFWDLDRIVTYLSLEAEVTTAAHVMDLSNHVRRELELVESLKVRSSLMALYYAVRALDHGLQRSHALSDALNRTLMDVVADVDRYVTADPAREERDRFARRLARIRERLTSNSAST